MRPLTILSSLFVCSIAFAQTPTSQNPQPQLSPQAAYEQATRPLEITRRSIENWSESETAALSVAVQQAKEQCAARTPDQYTGEDLIAYARLCSLGKQWPTVQKAATLYLNVTHQTGPEAKPASAFPGLPQAYAYMIESSLRLNDSTAALVTAREMLSTVPYSDLTSHATNETARYIQLTQTSDALSLLAQRHAVLLPLLRTPATPNPADPQPPLPLHTIYADAIALAALQQFANQPKAAEATIAGLETALPSTLTPDDSIPIAESRRQYALLGTPAASITPFAYLLHASSTPYRQINFHGAAVLLFPDWCAQCIRMGSQFMPAFFRMGQSDARFYALLAQATPPPTPPQAPEKPKPASSKAAHFVASSTVPSAPTDSSQTQPKTPADLLLDTPTFVVSNDILTQFAVTDFPFLIVTDHDGIIRFLQPAPENVLVPGGLADQVIKRVLEQWAGALRQIGPHPHRPLSAILNLHNLQRTGASPWQKASIKFFSWAT
ncbi:MAG TPA: hypothetical protein VIX90_09995 [Edaphobacter sp.]